MLSLLFFGYIDGTRGFLVLVMIHNFSKFELKLEESNKKTYLARNRKKEKKRRRKILLFYSFSFKALLLLCSLLGSFDGLITTLVYGKETLNYKEVVDVLWSNEQRKNIRMGSSNSEALAVIERQGRPKEKVRDKSRGRSKSKGKKKG